MMWGKGDSSKLTDAERQTLAHLQRMVETGHINALTPEQTELALAAIRFYGAAVSTTGILAGARNVLAWLGVIIVGWWAAQDTIREFIRATMSGGGGQ